jgi:hypothetical protein
MNAPRFAAAFLLALALQGCGGGAPRGESTGDGTAELRRREAEFTPSEFDQPPETLLKDAGTAREDSVHEIATPSPEREPELTPGFRVQIYSSSDIDEANAMKTAAEAQFPTERFYLVYDPPIYKVRAGDFASRHEADRFARTLKDGGYNDAWIVPDRVSKILPPR